MARRGYDPEAVDAHLSALATEVEGFAAGGSVAGAASAQVRAIVEAAEATAAQIRADAERQAGKIVGEAQSDAKAAEASAAAQAGERVDQVSKAAVGMLERIEAIDQELSALLDALRAGATRLNAELAQLQDTFAESVEPIAAGKRPARARRPARRASPAREPEAEVAPAPAAAAPPAAGNADHEAARLVALNMALSQAPRDEIDRYLSEHYDLPDRESLLDEVFAAVGG